MNKNNTLQTAIDLRKEGWRARSGDSDEAHRKTSEAVALFRQIGDRQELIRALKSLGHVEMDLSKWEEAGAL